VTKRGTTEQMSDIESVVKIITDSPILTDLWQRYQKKFTYAADVSWEMTNNALNKLAQM